MEIKKADSKGRVTGFEPGELYAFDRVQGIFSRVVVTAPDGRPIMEALAEEVAEFDRKAREGTAEEAERLLNEAMAKRNRLESGD